MGIAYNDIWRWNSQITFQGKFIYYKLKAMGFLNGFSKLCSAEQEYIDHIFTGSEIKIKIRQMASNIESFAQKSKFIKGPLTPLHTKDYAHSPCNGCYYHVIHSSHSLGPLTCVRDFEYDWCTHKAVTCTQHCCKHDVRNTLSKERRWLA